MVRAAAAPAPAAPPLQHALGSHALTAAPDDFDLPATDFDDNDEDQIVLKRGDEEKWNELCLEHFLNPGPAVLALATGVPLH